MTLSTKGYTVIKVIQVTLHQRDIRYVVPRDIQCSCISLISLSWTPFKSPSLCIKFDLNSILGKGQLLFRFTGKFRYLEMEGLPQEFQIENCPMNVEFLENKTRENTAGHICYLLQKLEIVLSKSGLVLYLSLTIMFFD